VISQDLRRPDLFTVTASSQVRPPAGQELADDVGVQRPQRVRGIGADDHSPACRNDAAT
jgi:hypothetical protein